MDDSQSLHDDLARELLRRADISPEVSVSELTLRLLGASLAGLPRKRSYRTVLSSTTFALAAWRYLETEQNDDTHETRALRGVFERHAFDRKIFDVLADEFFSEVGPLETDITSAGLIRFGETTSVIIANWKPDTPLSADLLLDRLFTEEHSGLFARVELARSSRGAARGDTDPPTPDAVPTPRSMRPGRHVRMVRKADARELVLDVHHYAKALATILRASDGEFSFALFGKWGSGKTTLLSVLRPLLEDPAAFREGVSVPPDESYASLKYSVVVHNAWKYRQPPESWIFLYRSLVSAVSSSTGLIERLALALRASTIRRGHGPMLLSLVLLAIGAAPLQAKIELGLQVLSLLGGASIYVLMVVWSAPKKVNELFRRNMRLVGSTDNLGMLALIGDDTRALLRAWTRDDQAWKGVLLPALAAIAVSAIWATGLLLDQSATFTGADVAHWSVWLVWTLFACVLLAGPPFVGTRRPDRVLLVVDDLDRCRPTEMLAVIENVRLLLDDDEINARLQVLMLVDEGVLNHAIALRYRTMIAERSASDEYKGHPDAKRLAAAEIVSEQVEKLFACHLRLSRLAEHDVIVLVQRLAGLENEELRRKAERLARLERVNQRRRVARQILMAQLELNTAQAAYDRVANGSALVREATQMAPANTRSSDGAPNSSSVSPDISDKAREFADRVVRGGNLAQHPEVVEAVEKAKARHDELRSIEASIPPDEAPAPRVIADAPFEASDVRFSDEEIVLLSSFVPRYFREQHRRASPRSIKAFLFKVQLARLLLQLRHPDISAEKSHIEELLRVFLREAGGDDVGEGPYALIVRQVI
ncbi:P-loop NTPase fold protein [uncultured Bradyrhizobium sp.]|jgi:hypothetical protein|uniref:P-loop NTPase fold protein n=1 Tax=uncultured Bradyrhizobium sp. TaxID=199684 RepID=UPI0026196AD4|nr:P-loop NTPase fold protein [uncultured Bradyrhizobium sp.]